MPPSRPKSAVPREVVEDAVRVACRAPSYHNSQPWRWVAEAGRLHLYADRDRLVATDQSGRQALISCGVVLDHLRVVMAAAGWTTDVRYCPDPDDVAHLASLEFTEAPLVTDAQRRRADAVLARRTDRLPFGAVPDHQSTEGLLHDAVAMRAVVSVLTDDARPRLAEASQYSESLRLYDSAYHAELNWWTSPFDVSDGIPQSALISAAESDRVDVGRAFPITHHAERRMQVPEDRSQLVVLSARGDSREDVLRCGEALSALLLECTLVGLATCTLTHVTEVHTSREIVASLTGQPFPQALVRIGTAPALDDVPPPTPRRPVTDVLEFRGQPAETFA
jgi:nitroreductase